MNLGKDRKKNRFTIRAKISILAMLMAFIGIGGIAIFSYITYRSHSISYHAQKAASVATTFASFVDEDRFFASVLSPYADDYWYHIQQELSEVLERMENLKSLVIIMQMGRYDVQYFAEGFRSYENPADFPGFRHPSPRGTYSDEVLMAFRTGDTIETGIFHDEEGNAVIGGFAPIRNREGHILALVGAEFALEHVVQASNTFGFRIALIGLTIAVAIGIIIRIFISRLLSKTLRRIVEADHTFAEGSSFISRDGDDNSAEDIGVLYQKFYTMFSSFQALIADVKDLADLHMRGKYNTLIDADKYEGGQKALVESLNGMVKMYCDNLSSLVGTVQKYGQGDFSAVAPELPGEWHWSNEAMRDLRASFIHITYEIQKLASNAAEGKFDVLADSGTQQGEWAEIIEKLNGQVKSVGAPLDEIRKVMESLSQGDFSMSVSGSYKGDFLQIKNAVNSTTDTLSGYISEITDTLSKVSAGDLTHEIGREYVGSFIAIKDSLNNISITLNKTMSEIAAVADQVLSGANQIANSATQLSMGAQEQSSSVQELNATIEAINEQTRQNVDNTINANELSMKSVTNAQEGNVAMQQMVKAMGSIRESSDNIGQIVQTIQNIAFQTNLLALNASVEAARAGEHGKGFAVVAEEVRSLAGRSQTAATETTTLIQDSIGRVESGSDIAETTAESLNAIVTGASEVLEIISSISTASKEQAEAISNMNDGLDQISKVTQNNSAVSEETAAAAQELNSQAELLRQMVTFFKL
ncbi:MAG: methyl-accepting chemotaxis protein [Defluviitaleaceae bacterium]|nr:methyl-accepting chemotaxis protein [Defluviitaleaceae bacterium]